MNVGALMAAALALLWPSLPAPVLPTGSSDAIQGQGELRAIAGILRSDAEAPHGLQDGGRPSAGNVDETSLAIALRETLIPRGAGAETRLPAELRPRSPHRVVGPPGRAPPRPLRR